MAAPNQPPNGTRKSITGFITKLVGDGGTFGFINDEIFFQQDVVIGGPVAINDRVFAECEYSENLPIKWNATSIKIIQKANASPGGPAAVAGTGGASDLLDSDPRRRQGLLSQQQASPLQQPYNQPAPQPVANTYQQHRQQRQQQQQMLRPSPFEATPNQADSSSNISHQQPPMRMLDQPNIVGPDFYPSQSFPHPVAHDIPPFQQQHDAPMGPPKITYTSQLGAAFVQNQGPMVPPPFIAQPNVGPQTVLAGQQQQGNQQQRKQSRFGNQGNKSQDINRQQDNRIRNRNDSNRSRDQERDSRTSQNDSRNQSSRSDTSSRDRSSGQSSSPRRSSRPSPPSHHPIRSRASASSERSGSQSTSKSSKRHCEPHNIPKSIILTNLNGWNMRSRCSSSIHVPSDLKDVIVNKYFRLDVKNTPKPIQYKIEPTKVTNSESTTDGDSSAKKEQTDNTQEPDTSARTEIPKTEQEDTKSSDEVKKEGNESSTLVTPPTSQPKAEIKLNHKYGVKVILISLPELETIYKNIFGPELDSYSSESSRVKPNLDESISLLCSKGPTGGHSLIGGKFDPTLDGFIEGEKNEFERHGRQPDLIATCRRVVLEQTGLDLGPCRSWTLLSTFIYNNKSDYFSPNASVEYSYIYMPQIWTMAKMNNLIENETLEDVECKPAVEQEQQEMNENASEPATNSVQQEEAMKTTEVVETTEAVETTEVEQASSDIITASDAPTATGLTVERLSDLKVVDLKLELDRRFVKYKPNAKKAELVSLLHEYLLSTKQQPTCDAALKTEKQLAEVNAGETSKQESPKPTYDEVASTEEPTTTIVDQTNTVTGRVDGSSELEAEFTETEQPIQGDQTSKRKMQDEEEEKEKAVEVSDCNQQEPVAKKICLDSEESQEKVDNKKEKVELIKEPFLVKAREGPQQLAIVSLHDTIQVSRYDQFELSVVSNLLKESLIQHLSEYILTALVEDSRAKLSGTINESGVNGSINSSGSASSCSNSQDTNNSDTNNNTSSHAKTLRQAAATSQDSRISKEYPVDRYINLACAYFDSTHVGYLHFDDLSKLFNNTGLTISKRALISLLGDNEKFNYRILADLSPKLAPTYIYTFPNQFNRLPGLQDNAGDDELSNTSSSRMIEYQGVKYNVGCLIQQMRDSETMRVNMIERFNYAIENFDKQSEEIHVLEVNQKSLSNAIKTQNEEISELKRERDSIKKKYDNLRKGIKSSVGSLNDLLGKEEI